MTSGPGANKQPSGTVVPGEAVIGKVQRPRKKVGCTAAADPAELVEPAGEADLEELAPIEGIKGFW